jgi:hypothetical protein
MEKWIERRMQRIQALHHPGRFTIDVTTVGFSESPPPAMGRWRAEESPIPPGSELAVVPHAMEEGGTLLWRSRRGLRCIVIPFFGSVQLRLLRGSRVVRTEVFADTTSARAAAKEWRRLYRTDARTAPVGTPPKVSEHRG